MTSALAKRLASDPVSKVELSIRCNNLINKDLASLSDPCCVVYLLTGTAWTEIGRTENIKNNLNPVFAKLFQLDYYFEEVQKIRFLVYDIDNTTPSLNDDDFLGSMECTLGEIVSNSPYSKPLFLKGTKVAGKSTITIRAQESSSSNEVLTLQFSAKNLDNKDFLGKSDPFLEFHRKSKDGGYQLVHRTEVVKNNLNPKWRAIEIRSSRLCGKDTQEPIKIECYDHDDDGSSDFIGSFETTMEQMLRASNKVLEWPCINPKKKAKKKNYTNSGVVVLSSCIVRKEFSFLDFVFGGLQINFTVGVDFTASNGDPRDPRSLHHMNPSQMNLYMRAIHSVGQVIQDYDSDQMFPALGYGAKIPPNREVSHCFPLNFNPGNPFCAGIQGVLDAYRMCLNSIQLYGPTNFSPIIYHVAQFAEAAHKERKPTNYYVLLIITDGVISDMDDTIRAIVYASTLPMSIIIVGVGEADFQAMDILDGDNGMLRDARGNYAKRDIVQFVPFRNFINSPPAALAKQVLAEVPDQVSSYYRLNNIEPGKPKPMDAVIKQLEEIHLAPASTPATGAVYPNLASTSQPGQPPNQHGHIPQGGNAPGYPQGQTGQQTGVPPSRPGYLPGQSGNPVVSQGHVPAQPGSAPGYPPSQMGQQAGVPPVRPGYSPGQSGYPVAQQGHVPAQPGYPSNQAGYQPTGQSGYPGAQPGYPSAQPGYPGAQPGYPGAQPGYPGAQPGYPGAQPGYPGAQPGYPGAQPGYPGAQPGYPGAQPGYPGARPGYPSAQPGYPQQQGPQLPQAGAPPGQSGYPSSQQGQYSQPGYYPPHQQMGAFAYQPSYAGQPGVGYHGNAPQTSTPGKLPVQSKPPSK